MDCSQVSALLYFQMIFLRFKKTNVIGDRTPGATLTLIINRQNGETINVPVTCRLDTAEELSVYEAGGVLQRFAQDFLASNQ